MTIADSDTSLAARLAKFFRSQPGVWIDGRELAGVAGSYAWRTRVSDLRRAPFHMEIENRLRHVRVYGQPFTISEYRFVVQELRTGEGAADGVSPSPAAA